MVVVLIVHNELGAQFINTSPDTMQWQCAVGTLDAIAVDDLVYERHVN